MSVYIYRICWIAATGFLAVVVGIYGFQGVYMLLRTRAVLGHVSTDGREGVRKLLEVSQQGPTLTHTSTVLLYVGLGSLLVFLVTREWLALVVAATPFTLISWLRIRTTTPPIVLLLRPSTPPPLRPPPDIQPCVPPLRVLSL